MFIMRVINDVLCLGMIILFTYGEMSRSSTVWVILKSAKLGDAGTFPSVIVPDTSDFEFTRWQACNRIKCVVRYFSHETDLPLYGPTSVLGWMWGGITKEERCFWLHRWPRSRFINLFCVLKNAYAQSGETNSINIFLLFHSCLQELS